MEDLMNKTIRELVTEDHRLAAVFEQYAIDFCCGGGKSVGAACEQKGIDPSALLGSIMTLRGSGAPLAGHAEWELDRLVDYIVDTHHAYVVRAIPKIRQHLAKLISAHGERHSELLQINELFGALAGELEGHMMKEERILFPHIKMMALARREGGAPPRSPFGSLKNPIRMMEAEHTSAGNVQERIVAASKGYTVPEDGCTTYRVTYKELEDFERDLHRHIHLENNILFPRAVAMEG